MASEKITVDEPLISTDVDSLIRTIAERKKVPLNELRQLCRIDKRTMDKWIAVLEDEGYITVEYGLRGTNVVWRDAKDVPAGEANYRSSGNKSQIEKPTEPEPERRAEAAGMRSEVAAADEARADDATAQADEAEKEPAEAEAVDSAQEAQARKEESTDFAEEAPLEDEPQPEELLSEYLARRRNDSADIDDIKSSILTSLKNEKAKEEKGESADGSADDSGDEPESGGDPDIGTDSEEIDAGDSEEAVEEAAEEAAKGVLQGPVRSVFPKEIIRPVERERAVDVRELMDSYLKEISKEKSMIEALKKEREALYREKFATMEGKMQADIVVLTEKIIEKESKIAELKERVLELPDKVEELGRLQEQMETLRKEGRDALGRTRSKADGFLASVGESKADVEEKISEINSVLDAQSGKVKELEKVSASLDARAVKLKDALEGTKAHLDEISSAMASIMGDLAQVEQMKVEVNSLTDTIKDTVSSHGEELGSLEEELEGIERMEHWVQEYIRDYEAKIEDIENYVNRSEDELGELKEAAESLYMRKYLGELESMTESYSSELQDAVSREKEIEMKIAESRARITDLVSESQQMIRKLKSDAPETTAKDFGVLVAKVKARTTRAKNIVEEKQQERAKLADDSRKTRRTAKPAPRASARKKAAAKSVSKKRRK